MESHPFKDFFECLAAIKAEIAKHQFDFAVVGAGAYSLLLLKFIKEMGVPCVHLGGQTQLLFGIRGKRWETEYTEESFDSQGFFHTGDLGFITSEGYITVTGRKKDLIIRGGENISPKEVEDFLHEHPSVQEAAVVAMPHARLGEAPCAYVVLRQGARFDMDAMVFFLEQARLARQKFPERLFLVESLPRTPSGKVLKHVLRERVRRSVEEGK
jgi:acyl-CoA synthetase (AMP-forming)/AMP-acid ligase II